MTSPPLQADWDFVADPVPAWRRRAVLEATLRRTVRAPGFACVKEVERHDEWLLYFVFAPDGVLSDAHRFTLARCAEQGFRIFTIVALGDGVPVPDELVRCSHALYRKGVQGYDFSAYALGLRALARRSPGCRALVLNDSVVGPLTDLRLPVSRARWDLTGFTANGKIENHIQSYAFIIRDLTPRVVSALRTVLLPAIAFGRREDVIACQETRLARVASKSMSVGAFWYLEGEDPTQARPFELIDAGFPFLKKSLLSDRSSWADKARARDFMHRLLESRQTSP